MTFRKESLNKIDLKEVIEIPLIETKQKKQE